MKKVINKITYEEIKITVSSFGLVLKTTEEEFNNEIKNISPSHIKIKYYCPICNDIIVEKDYRHFKTGVYKSLACKKCGITLKAKSRYMDFKNYIEGEDGNGCVLLTTEKEFIDSKINSKKSIKYTDIILKILCGECKTETFSINFNYFKDINIKNCRTCGKKRMAKKHTKTHEQYKKDIYDLLGDEYTVVGKYINCDAKILMRHNCESCGNYEWFIEPKTFYSENGSRCPKCAGNLKKNTDIFKQEIYNLEGDNYTILGEYTNNHTNILIRHNAVECNNYTWEVTPANFLKYRHCPICETSKGEKKVSDYLIANDIEFIPQKEYDGLIGLGGGNLSYDFLLPKYSLLIEYQGEFHDGSAKFMTEYSYEKQKEHDDRKRKYANAHNIKLLEIWYYDYDKIEEILNKELNNINTDKKAI